MTVEEILAALQAIIDGARDENGDERALTDEEVARCESLQRELEKVRASQETRARVKAFLTPAPGLRGGHDAGRPDAAELRAFDRFLRTGDGTELRALGKGVDTSGGFLVPDEWRDKLVECVKSFGGFAAAAEEVTSTHGRKWLWPTISDETAGVPHEGVITAEHAQFTGGADPTFGEGSLDVFKYTTTGAGDLPIRVSVELLQDSGVDVDALLRRLMGRRIARKQSRDFVVGTGTGQPLGILTGTPDAELTVSNSFDGTNNGYPLLVDIAETLLDDEYLQNASWLMNRTTYAQLLKLTDDNGRPLIGLSTDGIATGVGRQRTLLGYPVILDSAAPAPAADTNFLAFGDFREAYVVRRVRELEVIADPYARKNHGEVEYVAWQRAGGTVQNRCAYVILAGVTA